MMNVTRIGIGVCVRRPPSFLSSFPPARPVRIEWMSLISFPIAARINAAAVDNGDSAASATIARDVAAVVVGSCRSSIVKLPPRANCLQWKCPAEGKNALFELHSLRFNIQNTSTSCIACGLIQSQTFMCGRSHSPAICITDTGGDSGDGRRRIMGPSSIGPNCWQRCLRHVLPPVDRERLHRCPLGRRTLPLGGSRIAIDLQGDPSVWVPRNILLPSLML